jgi:hypothetical protein
VSRSCGLVSVFQFMTFRGRLNCKVNNRSHDRRSLGRLHQKIKVAHVKIRSIEAERDFVLSLSHRIQDTSISAVFCGFGWTPPVRPGVLLATEVCVGLGPRKMFSHVVFIRGSANWAFCKGMSQDGHCRMRIRSLKEARMEPKLGSGPRIPTPPDWQGASITNLRLA